MVSDVGVSRRCIALSHFYYDVYFDTAAGGSGDELGDELAVDFDANGLWNYDGTSWSKKTPWNPENLADVDLN